MRCHKTFENIGIFRAVLYGLPGCLTYKQEINISFHCNLIIGIALCRYVARRYDVKSNDRDLDHDLYEYHRRNHMKDEYDDLIENLIREISEGE